MPMAWARASPGKTWVTIAKVAGMMKAAETPIAARQATSWAGWVEKADSAEKPAKQTRPASNSRLWPARLPMTPALSNSPA